MIPSSQSIVIINSEHILLTQQENRFAHRSIRRK